MNAPATARQPIVAAWDRRTFGRHARRIGASALVVMTAVVTLLLARRLGGADYRPLDAAGMLAAAAGGGLACGLVRLFWYNRWRAGTRLAAPTIVWCATALVMLLLGCVVSLPESRWTELLAFWCPVVLIELGWWSVPLRIWQPALARLVSPAPRADHHVSGGHRGPIPERAGEYAGNGAELEADEELPDDLLQQLTRRRLPGGGERIFGVLRGEFEAGERQQTLHVAFCPPLAQAPQAEVHPVEGPEVQAKVAEVQTYGARIELRLARSHAEPTSVVLEFDAADDGPTC
ncbi:MAG: hypothetical protein J5I93_06120 [Pirellulaceae bacterium]|nr:hypothetical protein [Pirellulaceae bacterium]